MFHGWDTFYLLVGSAGGALIGVMFVVATLTAGLDPSRLSRGAAIYITPTVFHFSVVMVVSVITSVPDLSPQSVGVVLLLCAMIGIVYAVLTTARLWRLQWGPPDAPDFEDKCFYGILPTVAYAALAGAAAAIWLTPESATYAIGATLLVLLLIAIRNACDLATALVQRPRDPGK